MNINKENRFSMIPRAEIPRSSFDRTFTHKSTFDAGKLIPLYCEEVLPGDSINCHVNLFARLASPLKVPIMDDMFLDMHFFFVPNRLIWEHWQEFNGENKTSAGVQNVEYLVPSCDDYYLDNYYGDVEKPGDYVGLPISQLYSTGPGDGTLCPSFNILPFRAMGLIWNEWYRDENLQDPKPLNVGDSVTDDDKYFVYNLLPRGKRHDYFTSCLPWPQKGPGVELPIGDTAPVQFTYDSVSKMSVSPAETLKTPKLPISSAGEDAVYFGEVQTNPFLDAPSPYSGSQLIPMRMDLYSNPLREGDGRRVDTGLEADLSRATAVTINSMRQAFQLQRLYERDARGGTRYTEILRSHFGVISPDARLQRPEFLGGFTQSIIINPVAQTSSTDANSPQANLSAFGLTATSRNGFVKSFVEHGYIIGFASVRANLTYQQGLNRMWSRKGRFDFYWPTLAHLGEQAVLNKEIYAQDGDISRTQNDLVFGYQERWAEYRYAPSRITGKFNSLCPNGTLDIWHLSQKFDSLPVLNSEFIEEKPPMDRVTAVNTEPNFLIDCQFSQKTARVMPVYSVPGLIDHF